MYVVRIVLLGLIRNSRVIMRKLNYQKCRLVLKGMGTYCILGLNLGLLFCIILLIKLHLLWY